MRSYTYFGSPVDLVDPLPFSRAEGIREGRTTCWFHAQIAAERESARPAVGSARLVDVRDRHPERVGRVGLCADCLSYVQRVEELDVVRSRDPGSVVG